MTTYGRAEDLQPAEARRLKALIIEDDAAQGLLAAASLTNAGFETKVCTTGHAGIEAARSDRWHLILVDLVLPDLDGHEVIVALRAFPHGARAKIIAHTGHETTEALNKALAHGADDVYVKGEHKARLHEARFRGLASKFRHEEEYYGRLRRLEVNADKAAAALDEIAQHSGDLRDLADAWRQVAGAVRTAIKVGQFVDKSKLIWGPALGLIVWVQTGVVPW